MLIVFPSDDEETTPPVRQGAGATEGENARHDPCARAEHGSHGSAGRCYHESAASPGDHEERAHRE